MSRFILYANFGIWLNCSPKKILAAAVLFFLNRPSQMFYFFGGDSHSLIHSDVFFWFFFFIFSLWNTKKRDISSDNEEKRGRVAQAIETIVLWWRMIDGDDHIFFFRIFYFISPILFLPSFPFFSSMIMIIIFHIFYHSCRAVPLQCLLYSASSPFLKKQKEKKMRKKKLQFSCFPLPFFACPKTGKHRIS